MIALRPVEDGDELDVETLAPRELRREAQALVLGENAEEAGDGRLVRAVALPSARQRAVKRTRA
ncbi:MAG TPA: hypothetical protein VMV44_00450 [Rectinemataceae bacterium]|nr:hypothetical protein [Rectinemataceae bacterium]